MSTEAIEAVDVHAHYGTYSGGKFEIMEELMSGGTDVVLRRARQARTRLTMVSPLAALLPRLGGDPVTANAHAAQVVAETAELRQWVVVDPLQPRTYEQADEMLEGPGCVGIKMHPEEHGYPTPTHGRSLFEFAAEHGATVQSHSGEENSLPDDLVALANEYPEVTLLMSHLGCGWNDDLTLQVAKCESKIRQNVLLARPPSTEIAGHPL